MDGLKGGANAAWIGARLCSSARARKSGPEPRDATVERREARVPKGTRHLSKVPDQDVAPNGAPLPLWREEGREGAGPAPMTQRAEETRLCVTGDCARERGLFDM